ncbi:MAG: hypothetical protein JWM80_172, partial [Cyanobacteria bacterium RYN_339]|nr:hypothetical protein [Cyanobacteria bacterium RYN_339]
YWEFNLSPDGHWNVYRFEGYRSGMQAEEALSALRFTVSRREDGCDMALGVDLAPLGLAAAAWQVAVAVVVAEAGGRVSFWALAHPGAEPDFHDPGAFVLRL